MNLQIIMPAGAEGANKYDTSLDTFLRVFAEKNKENKGDWAEKYGTYFENDKFMMHPFCWCEKEECPWCSGEKPNFWYKPLDFKVWWYKYIGRGMDTNISLTKGEFNQMLIDSELY